MGMDKIVTPPDAYGAGGSIRADFIPADRYRAANLLDLEKSRLWPRVWQVVCRVEELRDVGDYVRYDICDDRIVVVRSSPTEIKAFYNVCQHRGRRLLDKPRGNVKNIYCKFHGWKWGLDGQIVGIPHREEWEKCGHIEDKAVALPSPQCSQWGGWVWVNQDPQAEPLTSYLGAAAPALQPFDFESLRRAWHVVLTVPVNWKVVIEAFNEGYHAGATHVACMEYVKMHAPVTAYGPHTMYFTYFGEQARAKRENGAWEKTASTAELVYYQARELYERLHALVMEPQMKAIARVYHEMPEAAPDEVYQRIWDLHREELEATGAIWPKDLTMDAAAAAGTSWQLFPNTILFPVADGVLWYRMRPHQADPDQCIFDIWCLRRYAPGHEPKVMPQEFDGFEAARGVNPFLEEDFANMAAVNDGMKSRGWRGARTNPSEELTVTHFHAQLDKYLRSSSG